MPNPQGAVSSNNNPGKSTFFEELYAVHETPSSQEGEDAQWSQLKLGELKGPSAGCEGIRGGTATTSAGRKRRAEEKDSGAVESARKSVKKLRSTPRPKTTQPTPASAQPAKRKLLEGLRFCELRQRFGGR